MRGLFFSILFVGFGALLLSGCATDEVNPGHRSVQGYTSDPGTSNAHPAAGITDLFQVNRPIPSGSRGPGVEFYFKRCHEAGENWPHSRTSYNCDYP